NPIDHRHHLRQIERVHLLPIDLDLDLLRHLMVDIVVDRPPIPLVAGVGDLLVGTLNFRDYLLPLNDNLKHAAHPFHTSTPLSRPPPPPAPPSPTSEPPAPRPARAIQSESIPSPAAPVSIDRRA